VAVDWTTTTQSGDTIAPPDAVIAANKLTLLDYYSFAKWSLGHHALIGAGAFLFISIEQLNY